MRDQTERALAGADVVMFVIDARTGITPIDRHFAEWLRERPVPVVLIANKCEGNAGNAGFYEAFELGFGEPVPLSAEHGEGLAEPYAALAPHVRPAETAIVEPTNDGEPAPEGDSGSNETEDDEAEIGRASCRERVCQYG